MVALRKTQPPPIGRGPAKAMSSTAQSVGQHARPRWLYKRPWASRHTSGRPSPICVLPSSEAKMALKSPLTTGAPTMPIERPPGAAVWPTLFCALVGGKGSLVLKVGPKGVTQYCIRLLHGILADLRPLSALNRLPLQLKIKN